LRDFWAMIERNLGQRVPLSVELILQLDCAWTIAHGGVLFKPI
jgi:hypothetical protein